MAGKEPAFTYIGLESRHRAGTAAMASGTIGLFAFAFLMAAVIGREIAADSEAWRTGIVQAGFWDLLFRCHDIGAFAQALLMIPAVLVLRNNGQAAAIGVNPPLVVLGVFANALIAISLALVYLTKASDMLYMLPQAGVGCWLLAVNRVISDRLSRWLGRTGMLAGFGLVVVGMSAIGIGCALGIQTFAIVGPVPTSVDSAGVTSLTNQISHFALDIGSVLGVTVYPVWAILIGRKLRQ